MIDSAILRLVAHLGTISLITAVVLTLLAAQGRPLQNPHWRVLIASLSLYGLWFFMLAFTQYRLGGLARGDAAYVLGTTEFVAMVTGWAWWARIAKTNFHLERDSRTRMLIF